MNNDENGILISLCRNLFECFVHLRFLRRCPSKARLLLLPALVDGKHYEFVVTSSGRKERKKVKNLQSGDILQVHYTIREMLQLSRARQEEALYDAWYPFLSSETHFSAELLGDFYDGLKFNIHRDQDDDFIMVNLGLAIGLVVAEIGEGESLSRMHRRDVLYGAKKIGRALHAIHGLLGRHVHKGKMKELAIIFDYMGYLSRKLLYGRNRRRNSAL